MPFYPFFGEGSPTKIDYSKKGTLIATSLLDDLDELVDAKWLWVKNRYPNGTLLIKWKHGPKPAVRLLVV